MKSVLQAVNLLTVAFGNVIVIIVAEAKAFEQVIDLTDKSMALIQPSFTWSTWNLYIKLPFWTRARFYIILSEDIFFSVWNSAAISVLYFIFHA